MTAMLLGSIMVPDIANPRPEDVDVMFMRFRLREIRRFSGHPAALTVYEHQQLCGRIAREMGFGDEVVLWARHHDDHEYATGDIPSPLQIAMGSGYLGVLQERWDVAICGALGIPVPTLEVRGAVSVVDRVARGLEWRHCLGRDVGELGLSDGVLPYVDGLGHLIAEVRP